MFATPRNGTPATRDAVLVTFVRPAYPEAAKRAKLTGAVTVEIVIDTIGKVTMASAISGPLPLRASAEEAVRQWQFEPAYLDGRPVASRRRFLISFSAVAVTPPTTR